MSVVIAEMAPPVAAGATWAQVGPALWVASARGEFLGTVEQFGDVYVARDGHAIEVGTYHELQTAKNQVLRPASRAYEARLRQEARRDEMPLAWATAVVGGLVIAASLVMIGFGLGS